MDVNVKNATCGNAIHRLYKCFFGSWFVCHDVNTNLDVHYAFLVGAELGSYLDVHA